VFFFFFLFKISRNSKVNNDYCLYIFYLAKQEKKGDSLYVFYLAKKEKRDNLYVSYFFSYFLVKKKKKKREIVYISFIF